MLVTAFFQYQYAAKEFGTCPLVQCSGQPVLPVGLKDEMGADTVKIFCPKCQQVYHTPPLRSRANISTGVDGAAFGTTFPHLFLMTFSNLVPDPLPAETSYVPRVFGFRVHQSAQRTLPSPEAATTTNVAPAPAAAAAVAAEKTGNDNTHANVNNGGNNANNNNANQRNIGDEDEDEKSPVQGEEGAANPPAAPAAPAAAGAAATAAGMNALPNANVNLNNDASAAAASSSSAAVRSRSKGKRGRKDDKVTAATAASTNAGTTVAPTFLMENPAKRRRRGAGNT